MPQGMQAAALIWVAAFLLAPGLFLPVAALNKYATIRRSSALRTGRRPPLRSPKFIQYRPFAPPDHILRTIVQCYRHGAGGPA